jgi:hypothetical protein
MGINFPNAPVVDQLYPSPPVAGLAVYRWDGEKWTTQGATATKTPVYTDGSTPMAAQLTLVTPPVATTDASSKKYVDDSIAATVGGSVTSSRVTGTTTNDDAAAGFVGEYKHAEIAQAASVPLPNNNAILSLPLTAGDWDVSAAMMLNNIGSSGTLTWQAAGLNTVNNAMPAAGTPAFNGMFFYGVAGSSLPNNVIGFLLGPVRFSLAAAGTIYLLGNGINTLNTLNAYGQIRARRVR